jgi:hypothetical protein
METSGSSLPKIVGVGFHKTGTKTLAQCLRILGYRHQSLSRHDFDLWLQGKSEQILANMENADSFDDWPWPLLFRQASIRFHNSRFILTTRGTEQKWIESLCNHVQRANGKGFPYRKYIYGYTDPSLNPAHHLDVYRSHNNTVREFFASEPNRLLEICWENGDGWQQLCAFLGCSVPAMPLPHCNAAPAQL